MSARPSRLLFLPAPFPRAVAPGLRPPRRPTPPLLPHPGRRLPRGSTAPLPLPRTGRCGHGAERLRSAGGLSDEGKERSRADGEPLRLRRSMGRHTVALTSSGALWAWGDNSCGQLGEGTTTQWNAPVLVGTGFASFAADGFHTVAVKGDETLWAWGQNTFRQIGDGMTTQRNSPVMISSGYASVAAGFIHTVAITPGSAVGLGRCQCRACGRGDEHAAERPGADRDGLRVGSGRPPRRGFEGRRQPLGLGPNRLRRARGRGHGQPALARTDRERVPRGGRRLCPHRGPRRGRGAVGVGRQRLRRAGQRDRYAARHPRADRERVRRGHCRGVAHGGPGGERFVVRVGATTPTDSLATARSSSESHPWRSREGAASSPVVVFERLGIDGSQAHEKAS